MTSDPMKISSGMGSRQKQCAAVSTALFDTIVPVQTTLEILTSATVCGCECPVESSSPVESAALLELVELAEDVTKPLHGSS